MSTLPGISTNDPAASAAAAAAAAKAKASGATSAAEQQDRFMQLLVAQMKNQDPLNPMDNAQMTSQIAQINTVGGIEKLNASVNTLVSAFAAAQGQSATQLVGRGVLIEGRKLQLNDGWATGGVQLDGAADKVTVDVLDGAGQVVRSIDLGAMQAGSRSFDWNGLMADGTQATSGEFSVRVAATQAGKTVNATALTAVQVRSVSHAADGAVTLDLGSAGVKTLDAVRSYL
jgi:flagellar basal-body rod modification protein FlgD